MSPLAAARANGYGRIAIGLALTLAPEAIGRRWIGADAKRPGTQVMVRGLGIRDLLLGFLTVHVAGRPGVGSRTLATVAIVDAVDFAATAAVRDRIPRTGALATMGLAAQSTVVLLGAALALRDQPG